MVHTESQENGQKEAKRCKFEEGEEEDEAQVSEDRTPSNEQKVEASPPAAMEAQPAPNTSHDVETNTGNKSLPVGRVTFNCNSSELIDLMKYGRWMSNSCPYSLSLLVFSPENAVTPSDTLIRRSISQQKTGVSITIDDPVRTARQPSPPRSKVSCIVHISNLVRRRCCDST